MSFSTLAPENRHCLWSCSISVSVFLLPFRMAWDSFLTPLISTLLQSLRASSLDLWSLSFVPLSLFQDSLEPRCECSLPWFPPIFSCIHLPPRVFSPWSPSPCFVAWKCAWGSKAYLTCSVTQGSLFFVAWCQCLENWCFLVFCPPSFFLPLFQVGS